MFSVLHGVVLRALPLPEPDRLVFLGERAPDGEVDRIGFTTFAEMSAESATFASLAVSRNWQPTLQAGEEATQLLGLRVSASYLRTLGVAPALGRDFTAEDDRPGAAPPVIVSR